MVFMNSENQDSSTVPSPEQKPVKVKFNFTLVKAAKVKALALSIARSNPAPTRAKMFTRVHEDFLIACEANLKEFVRGRVHRHPSSGKTLR
jgi:hypothetical protein